MKAKSIVIEPIKETTVKVIVEGESDLMLHARSRSYLQSEIWKQSNDKGAEMPKIFQQPKNIWEARITSIHWKNPIEYHDEDISLYTEEEWNKYMNENQPCILSMAFTKSFKEAFVTFFKDSTKKNGTDLTRSLRIHETILPITFAGVRIEDSIVPTTGLGSTSVLCTANVFSGWRTEFTISCPNIVFPIETILSLISATGKFIGIGSQRANGYGRYHIANVEQA